MLPWTPAFLQPRHPSLTASTCRVAFLPKAARGIIGILEQLGFAVVR